MVQADTREQPVISSQERAEELKRVDEFLHRLTLLSCELGVGIFRDPAGNPVVDVMQRDDYPESYALDDNDQLVRLDLSMAT